MIVLFVLGIIAAIIWTGIVVLANGMSDAVAMGFQGGWSILGAWLIVAALGLAWWVG